MGQDRAHQLRWTGGADRAHAPHAGRREEVDRRAALSLGAQLLHAAAGARGHAACNLRRLAPARPQGRARGGLAVRVARRAGGRRALGGVCSVRQIASRRGAVRGRQGGRAGDRGGGAVAGGAARPQRQHRVGHRRSGVRCHLPAEDAVPPDRAGGRPGRVLARGWRRPAGVGRFTSSADIAGRDAAHRRFAGSPSGSCRSSSSPPRSVAATCSPRSAGSSPSSRW